MRRMLSFGIAAMAAVLVAAGPAAADGPHADVTIHGFMRCEAEPTVHIGAETRRSPEGRSTIAHELDHLLVAQQFGSCDEFWAWVSSDRNALLMEARGFAASAVTAVEDGRAPSLPAAVREYGFALAHAYPFGVSEEEAAELIHQFTQQGLTVNGRQLPPPMSSQWLAMLPGYSRHLG